MQWWSWPGNSKAQGSGPRLLSVCLPQDQQGNTQQGFWPLPLPFRLSPRPSPSGQRNPELQLQLPRRQHTALVLLQRILPFSLSLAEGSDAGANLGYSAVLQTLLQLQLIIHSGCQWPRRQEREGNDWNQENGRDVLSVLTQQPSDSHGEVKNPHQTPPNTGTDTVTTHGHRAMKHQIL